MLDVYLGGLSLESVDHEFEFRHPKSEDGKAVSELIENCPPLDQNSRYCNLLQCAHFSDTCMMAYHGDELVGFVSGYILPQKVDTLFVWQVAVGEKARGKGLAKRMIKNLLQSPSCSNVHYIETTITQSNLASWGLFEKLAKHLDASTSTSPLFEAHTHFDGRHDTEVLLRIGSFNPLSKTEQN